MTTRSITRFALATALILTVPMIAMQFTDEVDWNLADFVVAGALLFGAGLAYQFLASRATTTAYRIAAGAAVGIALAAVWVSLAV
jgi:uncharacterized membrane protein